MNLENVNVDKMNGPGDKFSFLPKDKPQDIHIGELTAGSNFYIGLGDKKTATQLNMGGENHDIALDWHKDHMGYHGGKNTGNFKGTIFHITNP